MGIKADWLNNSTSVTVRDDGTLWAVYTRTLQTDLNHDRAVDIIDISIVAMAFGAKEGDENYNPIADLDNNKQINIVDVSIVAMDYGKTV